MGECLSALVWNVMRSKVVVTFFNNAVEAVITHERHHSRDDDFGSLSELLGKTLCSTALSARG